MDEGDPLADAELRRPSPRRLDELRAEVDAGAGDAVLPRPGGEHLARAGGEVQNGHTWYEPEGGPERRELRVVERVMDAVVPLPDHVMTGNVHGCVAPCAEDPEVDQSSGLSSVGAT